MIDVAGPVQSLDPGPLVVEAMRIMWKTMYPVRSYQNVDSRQLVEAHELTGGETLLDSVDLLLSGPLKNVGSNRKDANSQHVVLTFGGMADAAVLSQTGDKARAHVHLFCSA